MCDPATTAQTSAAAADPCDDRDLIAALRAGDPAAPARFVAQYGALVFGICLRMLGHRQDAEDVAQESLVRALRAIGGFDPERPLRPWLLGIAANRCRTALARRNRRPRVVDLGDREDPRPQARGELADELERALARLRPEYRLVFVLYHEQGLPYEEISRSLGRPIGTIKTWIHRARTELAQLLTQRGVGT